MSVSTENVNDLSVSLSLYIYIHIILGLRGNNINKKYNYLITHKYYILKINFNQYIFAPK